MLANSQHNKRLSRLKSHSRDEVRTVVPANYTELSGVLRAKIIMAVKLVMGAQRDSLEKLEKFGGEDGGVIFPHFRQDLENALRFELGEVGVMILRNQFPMNTIKRGERVDKVPGLIGESKPERPVQQTAPPGNGVSPISSKEVKEEDETDAGQSDYRRRGEEGDWEL